jgi:hypothetical protein
MTGPDGRDHVREYLCDIGEVAVERADIAAARFIDRRLAELNSRHVAADQEPLLDDKWIEVLWEQLAEIRAQDLRYSEDVRDWCNGVLTLLDDMRRLPARPHKGESSSG